MRAGGLRRLARRWLREERGSAVVEFAILMPLVLVMVIGGFYLWFMASAHNSLSGSAYRAARYLAVQGDRLDANMWAPTAARLIAEEITDQQRRNVWLVGYGENMEAAIRNNLRVTVTKPQNCTGQRGGSGDAKSFDDVEFTVRAELPLAPAETLGAMFGGLRERTLRLTVAHTSFLECGQSQLYYED